MWNYIILKGHSCFRVFTKYCTSILSFWFYVHINISWKSSCIELMKIWNTLDKCVATLRKVQSMQLFFVNFLYQLNTNLLKKNWSELNWIELNTYLETSWKGENNNFSIDPLELGSLILTDLYLNKKVLCCHKKTLA